MKTCLLSIIYLILSLFSNYSKGQPPSIQWQRSFGGPDEDMGYTILESPTGGYYFAGRTDSHSGDVHGMSGTGNIWFVRIDENGNIIRQSNFGGHTQFSDVSQPKDMIFTTDNCLLILGLTYAIDGDVVGNHGAGDIWVLKIDTLGSLIWQKCLGGALQEYPGGILQTMDGGYIAVGVTLSLSGSGDISFNHGMGDAWVVKLDSIGNIIWEKCFGGSWGDGGMSIVQPNMNEYLFAGATQSIDGDITNYIGGGDLWVVDIDSVGNLQWQHNFGGSASEGAASMALDHNGDIIAFCSTQSNDYDVQGMHGITDFWRVSIDSVYINNSNCYGGADYDILRYGTNTSDNGSILIGNSTSNGVQANCTDNFMGNFYAVKTDSLGNFLWSSCLGGSQIDDGYQMKETSDGGFIMIGTTESNDGDLTFNHGLEDIWVVKLSPPGVNVPELEAGVSDFTAYENSEGAIQLEFNAELASELNLSLFDLMGRCVLKENFDCIAGMNTHRTSSFSPAPGIYVLSLSDAKGTMVKKVFVNGGK